ncbi:MAG: AAA family ATPase [Bacillota bacterium]|nr:AAA family ATPase [Bacillota bacterium]
MQFKKIKFHNYRCFVDGELSFEQHGPKNINLIIGTNGAGKTEILFAFWWALYGFDFSKLKNKEATPYSLNSTLYKKLESGESQREECIVTIELEHEGTTYIVERKEEFRKTPQRIQSDEYHSISYYKPNHELSLPIRDENEVNKMLNKIIPKAILYGIIFDGERMKQLSSVDENSVQAIGGVINDITNVELIELCILGYQDIQKSINKRARTLARQHGKSTLEQIITEIDSKETDLNNKKTRRAEVIAELARHNARADELSLFLSNIQEVKKLEEQRKDARRQLEREENRKAELLKNYMDSLKRGYLLICDPLFHDVKELITKYDVPVGLTVEAVNNILKREKCICGEEWILEMRQQLEKLKSTLPPDNINSTIGEMVRQMELNVMNVKAEIAKDYKLLENCGKAIQKIKETIASLSAQILNSGSSEAENIEKEYENTQRKKWELDEELTSLTENIPIIEEELESKKKIKTSLSQYQSESVRIEKESRFVEKCIKALARIKEINKMTALNRINERLIESFNSLCDDANYGRQLYIVQYNVRSRYQLITYYEEQLNGMLQGMRKSGEYTQLISSGLSEDEVRESAIIRCAQSNSTGQSKMNTLAFVKAILDYSNDVRSEDSFEVTKEYPLLIDAPFGDIFDKNLEKSAESLSGFTHQVILMIAKESYEAIASHIGPHISCVYVFEKQESKTFSKIHPSSLEEIKCLSM